MRKVLVALASTAVLVTAGCGVRSYEIRLDKTLEDMRYRRRLDDNLQDPAKGKLEQSNIYLRPPQPLEGPAKEFQLTVLEPGKFDVAESFYEKENKANLYVLARIKRPKAPPGSKKAAPTPADTATRGEFNVDVLTLLTGVYNVELDTAKAKEEPKRKKSFRHLAFETGEKNVDVYIYGGKTNPYEVALIFEYLKAEKAALASKIDLCLGAFEVGEGAKRAFSGAGVEEDSGEGAAGAAPVTF